MKDDARELAGAIGVLDHIGSRLVRVLEDGDASVGAEMEDPEHVARRQRAEQEFLGIVSSRVASIQWIAGAGDGGALFLGGEFVAAAVGAVTGGAGAEVAGPVVGD